MLEKVNRRERELKEAKNVFADPKYMRNAWKSVGQAILQNPAIKPLDITDKEGNPTLASEIERYSYDKLVRDLDCIKNGEKRAPTELEMIMQCQMIKARFDTNAAVFIRDTLGAKPVDESKMDMSVHNPYEDLSDEELELLAKHREAKQLANSTPKLEEK